MPVERETRVRKENISAGDEDGIRAEKINRLKRSRSGFLSSVTAKKNEIDQLLPDPCNAELVKCELEKFTTQYDKFCDAHKLFCDELEDEHDIAEAEQYFQVISESLNYFHQKVTNWIAVSTASSQAQDVVSPLDSVSQLSKRHSSRGSRASSRSSLSTMKAKQATKRAELHAELEAQKCRQALEREELRLKLEKQELHLRIELEKANAVDRALQEIEKRDSLNELESKPKEPHRKLVLSPEAPIWHQPPQPNPSVAPTTVAYPHPAPVVPSSAEIIDRQNDIMREIIDQQQRATLPKRVIPTFGGNLLDYRMFIQAFEAGIECKEPDSRSRLFYLEQHTCGTAKELVRSCQHMNPEAGYKRARELLDEKFGQRHRLAMAYVDRVLSAESLKNEDVAGLENFSILLASCKNSLKAIGYLNKIENPESMRRIIEKLPFKLQERWRDVADDIMNVKTREVTIEDISSFVDKRVRAMSNPIFGKLPSRPTFPVKNNKQKSNISGPGNVSFVSKVNVEETSPSNPGKSAGKSEETAAKGACPVCEGTHKVLECQTFKEKSVKERFTLVRQLRLCFSCLRRGHSSKTCFQKKPCSECNGKHASLLHPPNRSDDEQKGEKAPESTVQAHCGLVSSEDKVTGFTGAGGVVTVLPIVPVKVRVKNSTSCIETYGLLDSGSNSTFCSESLVKKLGIEVESVRLKLTTLGSMEEVNCALARNLEVSDLDENKFITIPTAFTRPVIPVSKEEIPCQEDVEKWPHLQGHVRLPKIDAQVELLIGVDVPEALEPKEIVNSVNGGPYATRGELGWTVNGPVGRSRPCSSSSSFFIKSAAHPMCSACTDFVDVYDDSKPAPSREDIRFMDIMETSITQNEDLHYETALPVREPEKTFPNNRDLAERRLSHLKSKFQKQDGFKKDYVSFIEDIIAKGYAEKVPSESAQSDSGKVWYLPHHGIYHPKKPGKIRVVFDCSAKYRGTSLNDRLLQGPDLTNSVVGVLTRFRHEPVAVITDVEAMFHQVQVKREDRDLLRFLWWPQGDTDAQCQEYRMTVHIFGATSSPSCVNLVMRRHAEKNEDVFGSTVVKTVLRNFYVDDCLKSLPTTKDAVEHAKDLSLLMRNGGFKLTKWVSNDKDVMLSIPEELRAKEMKNLDFEKDYLPVERALGIEWSVETDRFQFKVNITEKPPTRRGILSLASSIYDPLGMVAPFVLPAKILLQDLCRLGLHWDDTIPDDLLVVWNKWIASVPELSKFSIDTCLKPHDFGQIVSVQIHHFSDASESAYGAVAYLRLVNAEGRIHCAFLLAKSRLAPLKKVTIPRLELAAATIAVRVNKMLVAELDLPVDEVKYWTDSLTVLRYLTQESKRFHTYVANRVAYIRNDTSVNQWSYVNTKTNPADDISRGMSIEAFLNCDRWKIGPNFLWLPECEWPCRPEVGDLKNDDPEVKKGITVLRADVKLNGLKELTSIFGRFSSWFGLKRFVVLCLRLQRRFRKARGRVVNAELSSDRISVKEMEEAEKEILKAVQLTTYSEEIEALRNASRLKKSSPLIKLDPVLVDGVLCVGGRLSRAPVPDTQKHQMIVPKHSHVANLIVWHFHIRSGHSGREHVLGLVREGFWLVNAHSTVRSVLHNCFVCRRHHAPVLEQKMADLPLDRIVPDTPPFTHTGVDYFGPLYVKQKRSTVKRYGAIFTCLVVRAVHIEIAHSLDTDSFIQALRRFIARRGQVQVIRSDNGTNFVGAEKELRAAIRGWNQEQIHNVLLQKNIEWQFNPPAASHHGGVWERCIRSVRKVLSAILKQQTLSDESLQTLLCEVEYIINSRPLTTVSDDPKDLEPLTPNHLLQLRQPRVGPPGVFNESDLYCRRRWRQVQFLSDLFWKRWLREYLPRLQVRQKWFCPKRNLSVGDIVLVVEESCPRNNWRLGRVAEVYPDNKGFVRSGRIMTNTTTLVRPVSKLCLLEGAVPVKQHDK